MPPKISLFDLPTTVAGCYGESYKKQRRYISCSSGWYDMWSIKVGICFFNGIFSQLFFICFANFGELFLFYFLLIVEDLGRWRCPRREFWRCWLDSLTMKTQMFMFQQKDLTLELCNRIEIERLKSRMYVSLSFPFQVWIPCISLKNVEVQFWKESWTFQNEHTNWDEGYFFPLFLQFLFSYTTFSHVYALTCLFLFLHKFCYISPTWHFFPTFSYLVCFSSNCMVLLGVDSASEVS